MIDFDKLPDRISNVILQHKPRLKGLIMPYMRVFAEFQAERNEYFETKKKELSYNSKTWSLEKMLNDKYPNGGIYIRNISRVDYNAYIGHSSTLRPLHIGHSSRNKPASFSHSNAGGNVDFIVYVSSTLVFDLDEMTDWVNKYKRFSKRFIIETYEPA